MVNIFPSDIVELIHEQIYQNEFFSKNGENKITTFFYGPPGVGKTEILLNYPIYRLEKLNNDILKENNINLEIKYNLYESIDSQNEMILVGIPNEIKNKILSEKDVAVVLVTQSDFIAPEDISGLPNSSSELSILLDSIKLKEKYYLYSDSKVKNFDETLKLIDSALSGSKLVNERNTTKFDYTEWELKVHNYATDKNIKHILLILDDVTRAASNNTAIMNVLMPIFQKGIVGQRILPKNCSVIVTSNESQDTDGDIYFVPELDKAQNDRLFKFKVDFNREQWIDYASIQNIHPLAIEFVRTHSTVFEKITPRRYSQFGRMLYNRFNTVKKIDKSMLSNLLNFNFNDVNNQHYQQLIVEFKNFTSNVSNEIDEFIEMMDSTGFSEDVKVKFNTFIENNDIVKMNIIVHKLGNLLTSEILTEKMIESINGLFFEDDMVPDGLLHNLKHLNKKMFNMDVLLRNEKKEDENLLKIYIQSKTILDKIFQRLIERKKINDSETKEIYKNIRTS